MKNEFSHSWSWSRIQIIGPDASDFAHRMFSRNIKSLSVGEARLSLFLSAEAQAQNFFWVAKRPDGLEIVLRQCDAESFRTNVEKFHFAEKFSVLPAEPIKGYWTPSPNSATSGEGNLLAQGLRGFWRNTLFEFEFSPPSKQGDETLWTQHRIQNLIPSAPEDFTDKTLIFDVGIEDLCDHNKGCYIGQEVVERLRTRAGHGPRKLVAMEWNGRANAGDQLLEQSTQEVVGVTTGTQFVFNSKVLSLAIVKHSLSASPDQKFCLKSNPQVAGQIYR